ncbi:hypothetical protein EG329_013362 [Mollisiaceae sp. DMI_Dod_QoI]|nr:hypothetical protein EG329_013362 [Helotiales sp. DMI_Dod_QoI]
MGVVLACFVTLGNSIKDSRDKKKSSAHDPNLVPASNGNQRSEPQSLSPQPQDVQRGLADEHLASVPPPATGTDTGGAVEGIAGESQDVTRIVGVGAPVPVLTASANHTVAVPNGEAGKRDKMASDEDYAAFLDKVNQDPNEGVAKGQSNGKIELKATDKGASVPEVLKKATQDAFYVSDADEPFVPVCLKHSGKTLPDEVTFAKLVGYPNPDEADVEIMDIAEWDQQGQYKELVDATREASKGSDVRVYRISKGGSRVEYWVVGLEGGKLVGVKALAIES